VVTVSARGSATHEVAVDGADGGAKLCWDVDINGSTQLMFALVFEPAGGGEPVIYFQLFSLTDCILVFSFRQSRR
jgi:hypothetical protein